MKPIPGAITAEDRSLGQIGPMTMVVCCAGCRELLHVPYARVGQAVEAACQADWWYTGIASGWACPACAEFFRSVQ